MKRDKKLFLVLGIVLFFYCLSISAAAETNDIMDDNSLDCFETTDCPQTQENPVSYEKSLNKDTEKSTVKEASSVNVTSYQELVNQVNNIQEKTQKNHVINLKPGNYNATEQISLKSSNGINYNLTINGNNVVLDGQNRFEFMRVENCTVEFRNVTLKNFYTQTGDSVFNILYSNASVVNSTFINNSARYGGALYTARSNISIVDSTFINNTAIYAGGAVYVDYSNINVTNATIFNNTSDSNSGGMAVYGVNMTMTDVTFINNTSKHRGGAIYIDHSKVDMADITLKNNSANYEAGAIFGDYSSIVMSDMLLAENYAKTRGGAIFTQRCSKFNITNSTIRNNRVDNDGGALYSYQSNVSIIDSELVGSRAASEAGAIYSSDSNTTIINTTFTKNRSDNAAGTLYSWISNINLIDSIVSDSYANFTGGAMFLSSSNVTIINTALNNSTSNKAGLMYTYYTDIEIINSTVTKNRAVNDGGAVYVYRSNINITGTALTGNRAARGGAIFNDSSKLTLEDSTFKSNKATEGNNVYNYLVFTTIVFDSINKPEYRDTVSISGSIKGEGKTIFGYKNVDLFINDMNKSLTTSYDGKFSTKVKLNATGTWIIKAIFNGNEACKACNATMSFDVSKRKTTLKMNVSDLFLNREATLTGNLTDKTNTKLRNANIYVVVNGKRYHVLTNENGTYVVNYTPTKKGTNNLTVLYKGNPNYEASNITTTFEVDEDIVIRSTYYRDSITITACLTDGNELLKNVKVNLTINNETVSVKTDENGILYYACKSKIAGNNMLEICYGNQKWTRNFVTEKRSTSLTFKVSKITLNQQCTITGNLTDQSGTKLRNANIYVTLNGQRYHLLTDVFGTYSLNFTPTQVGKYNITVLYKGNSNYSPSQLNKTITVK